MARVGILGGSFNPVHNGHMRLAEVVRARLGLDRVELVPAGEPPHKPDQGMLPFAARAELCRVAVAGLPDPGNSCLDVNLLEGDRPGPSYTIDTLRWLERERPDDDFTFILGLGAFLLLPQWRHGLDLVRHAHLAVAARPDDMEAARSGEAPELESGMGGLIARYWPRAGVLGHGAGMVWQVGGRLVHYLEGDFLVLSASGVRERWLAGESIDDLVPQAVAAWLDAHADQVRAAWTA